MDSRADPGSRRGAARRGRAQAGRGSRALTLLTALAPAKVNLFLHVGPPAEDGYHPLASLVAFADVGDRVSVDPADGLSLTVTGPFADVLAGEGDNLVLKALRALGRSAGIGDPSLAVTLDKRLPIAAGLGGGSSDAGAALRLANRALGLGWSEARLADVARVVGADGPMCLIARAAWAEGIGDRLTAEPSLPRLPALLVNPARPSPTGAVYRAYDAGVTGAADRPAPPPSWSVAAVIDWLAERRNDLEDPAVALEPRIGEALALVRAQEGARLARMSGSGATVFGLFDAIDAAEQAAARVRRLRPDWWVTATLLGDNYGKV